MMGRAGATAVDPVCGMTVDVEQARADDRTLDHDGRTYAFCSKGCRLEFEESPDTYAEENPAQAGPDQGRVSPQR
jgi:YHS domain-containing protein